MKQVKKDLESIWFPLVMPLKQSVNCRNSMKIHVILLHIHVVIISIFRELNLYMNVYTTSNKEKNYICLY